jgi:hypothetical protein
VLVTLVLFISLLYKKPFFTQLMNTISIVTSYLNSGLIILTENIVFAASINSHGDWFVNSFPSEGVLLAIIV